jgi:hypothetical protein
MLLLLTVPAAQDKLNPLSLIHSETRMKFHSGFSWHLKAEES